MARLVECVPNFSEGRNRLVIEAIADAIKAVPDVKLLDVDPGADTNRTVYTFVGPPDAVAEAAVRSAHKAYELIDMSRHRGAHPRMGALDVCPIVPIAGVSMEECAEIARGIGRRIGEELKLPVYFYERAATSEKRRSLADVRAGEYEGLERKLQDPEWAPDAGVARYDPRFGAAIVGAREFLIAYNVNLNTRDRRLANEIALDIRENGRIKKDEHGATIADEHGQPVRVAGRLKAVRAIGWYIEQYRQAQVSINLIDYKTTPLHVVYETVREEADKRGLIVTGSELVGLMPLQPLLDAGRFYLRKQGKSAGAPEREVVEIAVRSLGLDQLAPFDPAKKIIEYQFRERGPLAAMPLDWFADEVSAASPAPGGGSVAALAGALGAALSAMVANLTVGKKGYEAEREELSGVAERAQAVKDQLVAAVDQDTAAFNGVIAAMRLPKATSEQQAQRDRAVEAGYQAATRVPLQTARLCLDALKLSLVAAEKGNVASASDAGVAALVARAGVQGAVLNVLTNLRSVKDSAFRRASATDSENLELEATSLCEQVTTKVRSTFKPL